MIKFFLKLWRPFFLACLLVGLFSGLSRLPFFQVRRITCQLDAYPCPLTLEPVLASFYHQNLFQLKRNQLINQILALDPDFSQVKIAKILPQRLSIEISRQPTIGQVVVWEELEFIGLDSSASATISGQSLNQLFNLKKNGQINPSPAPLSSSLPQIIVPAGLEISATDCQACRQIVQLLASLKENYVNFQELAWFNPELIVVSTALGPYALINPEENLTSQVGSLQYILGQLKIGEQLPAKIDLRFDKPVLSY